jgi:sugar lactone lactonase YvrE
MKTNNRIACRSFTGAVCAGAALMMVGSAPAQNLFVGIGGGYGGGIYEYTPGGARSPFGFGLEGPVGLAFNSAGNLFVTDEAGGTIYEYTPGGVQSTFYTGIGDPLALAFNSAGDLFVSSRNGYIYEFTQFTPVGAGSKFASGVGFPYGLAFNSAGDLFESDQFSGNIYKYTPGGVQSIFASGLNPAGLAFNSAGDLFESDFHSGNIYEFTPGGVRSIFASGLDDPEGLAFDSDGNLFEADYGSASINKFTPGGVQSTFASELPYPVGLAFQGETLPVPEPSALGLLAVGTIALLVRRCFFLSRFQNKARTQTDIARGQTAFEVTPSLTTVRRHEGRL